MIRVLPDAEAASRAAAEEVVDRARAAVDHHARFDIALAGGRTPRRLYEILATELRERVPWDRTHIFWGDERCVPPDDRRSNYRMARETLLDQVPVEPAAIHRIPGELGPGPAASEYHALLADHFGTAAPAAPAVPSDREGVGSSDWESRTVPGPVDGGFDLVLLGAGADGHTASLFPGQVEPGDSRWARGVQAPDGVEPTERVTLTLRALNARGAALFVVLGEEKRAVVTAAGRRLDVVAGAGGGDRDGDRDGASAPGSVAELPAVRVRPPGGVLWIVDEAAGAELRSGTRR